MAETKEVPACSVDEVVSISLKELTKVLRNRGMSRLVRAGEFLLEVRFADVLGVYYRRAPKAVVRLRGVGWRIYDAAQT